MYVQQSHDNQYMTDWMGLLKMYITFSGLGKVPLIYFSVHT